VGNRREPRVRKGNGGGGLSGYKKKGLMGERERGHIVNIKQEAKRGDTGKRKRRGQQNKEEKKTHDMKSMEKERRELGLQRNGTLKIKFNSRGGGPDGERRGKGKVNGGVTPPMRNLEGGRELVRGVCGWEGGGGGGGVNNSAKQKERSRVTREGMEAPRRGD